MCTFALNIAQKRLVAGLRLDPLGEFTAVPDSVARSRGSEGSRKAGKGERMKGGEERERKGREKKGKEWERRKLSPFIFSGYAHGGHCTKM